MAGVNPNTHHLFRPLRLRGFVDGQGTFLFSVVCVCIDCTVPISSGTISHADPKQNWWIGIEPFSLRLNLFRQFRSVDVAGCCRKWDTSNYLLMSRWSHQRNRIIFLMQSSFSKLNRNSNSFFFYVNNDSSQLQLNWKTYVKDCFFHSLNAYVQV